MAGVSRRNALKALGGTLGAAAFARAAAPLAQWAGDISFEAFVQKHYKELSLEEMRVVLWLMSFRTPRRLRLF